MANKQPIYEFSSLTSLGVSNVPIGSLVSVKNAGKLFTLTSKAGLTVISTVQDALDIVQNAFYRTDVTGATGSQGIQGEQGIPGPKGDIGSQGIAGDQGLQGDPGAGVQVYGSDTIVNIRGKANADGHMWISTDAGVDDLGTAVNPGDGVVSAGPSWLTVGPIRGPQGQQGPIGNSGADGIDGSQGIQGIQGPEGPRGVAGDTGSQGATGQQGLKGDPGDKGDVGDDGLKGDKGDTGDTGTTGSTGAKGDPGVTGAQGPKGDTGDQGIPGVDASVEFASQVETDEGIIDNKAISPKTLGAAGTMPIETGKIGQTVTNDGVRKGSFWSPFVHSPNVVSENFSLQSGVSASIVSPTINDGITVTVPDGSILVIL